MRISCPGCQTDYDVPDEALAGRTRKMRCAQCGHQWSIAGDALPPPAEPVWPAAVNIPAPSAAPPTEPGAWPGATTRNIFEEAPRFATAGFEPAATPNTSTAAWPTPPETEAKPERNPFVYDGPSSTADILASLARKPGPDEEDEEKPAEVAEPNNNGAIPGNEERFAALVKSSRSASPEDIRGGRAGVFTTFLVLIAICGGLWAYRDQVMHTVPATTPIFNGVNNLLGIHPAPPAAPTAPK